MEYYCVDENYITEVKETLEKIKSRLEESMEIVDNCINVFYSLIRNGEDYPKKIDEETLNSYFTQKEDLLMSYEEVSRILDYLNTVIARFMGDSTYVPIDPETKRHIDRIIENSAKIYRRM